jgi:hypothetical protein
MCTFIVEVFLDLQHLLICLLVIGYCQLPASEVGYGTEKVRKRKEGKRKKKKSESAQSCRRGL